MGLLIGRKYIIRPLKDRVSILGNLNFLPEGEYTISEEPRHTAFRVVERPGTWCRGYYTFTPIIESVEVSEDERIVHMDVVAGTLYHIRPKSPIDYAEHVLPVVRPKLSVGYYQVLDVKMKGYQGLREPIKVFAVDEEEDEYYPLVAYEFVRIEDMLGDESDYNSLVPGEEYYIIPRRSACQLTRGVYTMSNKLPPFEYGGPQRFRIKGSPKSFGAHVYKFYKLRKEGTIVNEGKIAVEEKEQVIDVVVVADSEIIFQGKVLATSQNAARDKAILDNSEKLKQAKQYKVLTKPF